MYVPDYVVIELKDLPRMTESIHRSYEHIPDVFPYAVEEEIDDAMCRIMDCVTTNETAEANLQSLYESQCQHDVEFDQGEFKFAHLMNLVGFELYEQLKAFGMYYDGSFLPYFFKERLGYNAIILQHTDHRDGGNE